MSHDLNPVLNIDNWHSLELHELCTLFPASGEEDYQQLVESMRKHGYFQTDPIVLIAADPDSPDAPLLILDGRNRYNAALDAGVTPSFVEYVGDDPLGFVTSRNLARRHLTTGQKAALAASIANLRMGENAREPDAISQKEAAQKLGVSAPSIRRYKKLERENPELAARVKNGELSLEAARKMATSGQPPEVKDDPEPTTNPLKERSRKRIEERKAEVARQHEEHNSRIRDIVNEAIEGLEEPSEEVRAALLRVATRAYLYGREAFKMDES